jgi:hypothetical protein
MPIRFRGETGKARSFIVWAALCIVRVTWEPVSLKTKQGLHPLVSTHCATSCTADPWSSPGWAPVSPGVVWQRHLCLVAPLCDSSLHGSFLHAGGDGGRLCMLFFCMRPPALPCKDKTWPPCCYPGSGIPCTACGVRQASFCPLVPFPQRLHSP